MADKRKAVSERLIRLTRILRSFLEKDEVYTSNLAADFATTTRTIQRDLLALRKAGFPIHEKKMGLHCMEKNIISNMRQYEDSELALIVAIRDMVTQLASRLATMRTQSSAGFQTLPTAGLFSSSWMSLRVSPEKLSTRWSRV
jgi:predicted DNA-binding transcriptional regulator YafY